MGRWSGATDAGSRVFEVWESPGAHRAWLDGTIKPSRRTLGLLPLAPADTAECAIPLVREPLGETAAAGLAQVFKALGDPIRLRPLSLIGAHQGGEVCVCDLTPAFDLTQPTISHLKVLREAGSSPASAAAPGSRTASRPLRWTGWVPC